jgi:hypothetical protein
MVSTPCDSDLFGIEIGTLDMGQTVDRIMTLIDQSVGAARRAQRRQGDPDVERRQPARRHRACPVVNADGQSVVVASRQLRRPLPEQVAESTSSSNWSNVRGERSQRLLPRCPRDVLRT